MKFIVSGHRPHSKRPPLLSYFNGDQRLSCVRTSVSSQLYLMKMLISVSIAAGFQLILSWAIMVVEELLSCRFIMEFVMAVLKFHPPAAILSSFQWWSKLRKLHLRSCQAIAWSVSDNSGVVRILYFLECSNKANYFALCRDAPSLPVV